MFIESEGELSEKLRASIKKLAQEEAGAKEGDPTRRDLGKIMVELGNLLKKKQFSENELLSMISSHLNLKQEVEAETQEAVESDDGSSEDDKSSVEKDGGESTDKDKEGSRGEVVVSSVANAEAKKVKPPYVNLQFSDEEEPPVVSKEESSQDKAVHVECAPDKVTTTENKPSYVNLLIGEDDKPDKLENYKPSYINMEYLTKTSPTASDDELSEDDYNYVEPSKAIGNRRLLQASESMKSGRILTTQGGMDICPLKTEASCIVRPEPSFVPTPRPRSQSSIASPTHKQQPLVLLRRQEHTLSDPPDSGHPTTTTTTSATAEELTEESDLDFTSRSSPWNRTGREQALQEPTQRARHDPVQGRARVNDSKGATANTSSYNLALEMEDIRFSRSLEVGTAHKTKLSQLTEEEEEEDGGKSKMIG